MIDGSRKVVTSRPLTKPSSAPNAIPAEHRQPGVEAGDHQQRRDDRREIEHPSDRQVDLADRQQINHPERQHALERGVAKHREQIDRIEEAWPRKSDDADHDDQRDEDANLLGRPPARSRRRRADRPGFRQGRIGSRPIDVSHHWALSNWAGLSPVLIRCSRRAIVDAASGDLAGQPASIKHKDPVAEPDQFRQLRRAEYYDAALRGHLPDQLVDFPLCADVDAAGRDRRAG